MNIFLNPQRRDDTLTLEKQGDVLIINGEAFDFSPMDSGDTLPRSAITSQWIVGDVDRTLDGELNITVTLPNPWNYSPEQAFPEPLMNVENGPVALPQPLGGAE